MRVRSFGLLKRSWMPGMKSLSVHLGSRRWPLSLLAYSSADKCLNQGCDGRECLAPIPNICQDLHVSDGVGASYSDLHSLKRQGQPGKSLTAGQKREKKKPKKIRVVVVECMFAPVACTHSHAHTLALKRSHQDGMPAVFIYHGGAHLIEGLIFMGFANRTLPLPPRDRIWPSTHGESTIWHMQPLIIFSFQCCKYLSFHGCPPFLYPMYPPPSHHHSEMSLMIELSFTHFKWLLWPSAIKLFFPLWRLGRYM